MRSCAVIDFYTPIICHVIQRGYRYNMVSDDIDTSCEVNFFDSKVDTKKPDPALYMGKFSHYYDVVSINVVEFIDKQRNDNDTMIFSIKLFGKDDNDIKLYKQLTTIVHHD